MLEDAEATGKKGTAAVGTGKMAFDLDTAAFEIVVRRADPTGPERR